jgi:hypothetical protein
MHGKMPTDENLRRLGCIIVSVCCFCLFHDETSEHLFLRCSFAMEIWNWIGGKLNFVFDCTSFELLLLSLPQNRLSQVRDIFFGCCCAYSPFDLVSKKYRHFS